MTLRTALAFFSTLAAATVLTAALYAADEKPAALTETERLAKGKDLIDSVCFWCHEPELMETKRLSKPQWSALIRGMIYEGAPVTEEEFGWIVEYLAKNFGPEPGTKSGDNK